MYGVMSLLTLVMLRGTKGALELGVYRKMCV